HKLCVKGKVRVKKEQRRGAPNVDLPVAQLSPGLKFYNFLDYKKAIPPFWLGLLCITYFPFHKMYYLTWQTLLYILISFASLRLFHIYLILYKSFLYHMFLLKNEKDYYAWFFVFVQNSLLLLKKSSPRLPRKQEDFPSS